MTYVAKITSNGELTIGGGQCRVAKDVLEAAISEFNAKADNKNILGHLRRNDCEEVGYIGFSHRVVSTFCRDGEAFAVIEPINTPDGNELNRMLKDCKEVAENNDRYEFAAKGFMDHGELSLTSIDVIKK